MLLDEAMQYQPDQIVWLVTLQSFPRDQQLYPPIVQNNAARVRDLIARYDLQLDPHDSRFVDPDFFGKTIIGQRRALADWLRLQLYGFSWAATGIDQVIPAELHAAHVRISTPMCRGMTFNAPHDADERRSCLRRAGGGHRAGGQRADH